MDDHAGTPRVDAAVLDLIADLFQARLRFLRFRTCVFERRLLLCELQVRPLRVSRVGEADDDIGALARERELVFALLELVGRPLQLFARDEPFLQQRLQLVVLLTEALDFFLRRLQPCARLFDAECAFALRHRLDGGLRFLPLDLRDL